MAVSLLIVPVVGSLADLIIMLSGDKKELQLYEVNGDMVRYTKSFSDAKDYMYIFAS